ncbi:hypothetical protein BG60_29100 [Caballeronia zhejiangensis]|uniref:Uncharacterized protein n=1 Tax=Caballeronia zhejiangensis TaxID=871203 RepID=A0A656QRW6_9BURK|nr:hypothetical protein BG60_29100 [Caballeronia zhejiangensis]
MGAVSEQQRTSGRPDVRVEFYAFAPLHAARQSAHQRPIDVVARCKLNVSLSMSFVHQIYGYDRSPSTVLKRQLHARASLK